MKKTRITATHQLEKTIHIFLIVNTDKLSRIESDRKKKLITFNRKVRFNKLVVNNFQKFNLRKDLIYKQKLSNSLS
jgi:hypothetical protein